MTTLVATDDEFDAIMNRLHERCTHCFADPFAKRPCEINHRRGVYFRDPDGHSWEATTSSDRGLP
jgi:catechol 2,3-dioxygenase-like lactoylglutathione lyase family enzyme